MKISEILTELFDPKYSFAIEWDRDYSRGLEQHAVAYDRQGRELNVDFVPYSDNVVEIEFSRGGSHAITGRGDAERVFATVMRVIGIYLSKYHPKFLIFLGSEASRNSLYRAMVTRYAPRFGYEPVPIEIATDEFEGGMPGYNDKSFALERL